MFLNYINQWSIKTKVTIAILFIFVTSIGLVVFSSTGLLYKEMERLTGDQQFSTVEYIASEINDELIIRIKSLENIALQISPQTLNNAEALQEYLEQRQNLQLLFNGGSFVLQTDGTAIADVPVTAGRRGVNYMDRDFIQGALKDGKTTIGRPVIGKKLKSPIFVIGVPIRDANSRIIGAVAGVTNLGLPNFLDKITKNRYGNSGNYFLTMKKYRQIVTSSDKTRIMEILPAPGVNYMVDRYINGFEGSLVSKNPRDVEVLSSSKSVPLPDWVVTVSLPAKEAFAPIHAMQIRMLLLAFILIVSAGALTWQILKYLLTPVNETIKTIKEFSESKKPMRYLPIEREDEIGDLIGSFNRFMTIMEHQSMDLQLKNEQLENEIRERKFSEDKVRSLLEEKEIILREVNHRIKNNMNIIHGLLTLQSYSVKDSAAVSSLQDSANRVQSMMLLYDKLYHSADVQNIQAADYFSSLVDQIISNFDIGKSVKIKKNLGDFILDAKRLQTLGIIINELLTNIMKYAFTDSKEGLIMVSASMTGDTVSIEVYDDGKGLPESVDFENSTGFGLQLVRMLAKELHGTIRIESGGGTKILLEFKK